MSHIKVHLNVDKEIYELIPSEEDAAGVGFDDENQFRIGQNVRWFNKKDGNLTGEIIELENKKAIIKDDRGRTIKVLLKKLEHNPIPKQDDEEEASGDFETEPAAEEPAADEPADEPAAAAGAA